MTSPPGAPPLRSLSVVIPAYNEETRLPGTLRRVQEWLGRQALEFSELIVVDDGSRDNTVGVAEECATVRLLRNPGNRGKGYAVRHGMLEARGEWILYSDADLSAPIEDADILYRSAIEGAAAARHAPDQTSAEDRRRLKSPRLPRSGRNTLA